MILSNPGWVGYFDRTYDQIKANVLTKFQALVPEITDHTETNPWVKGISIWSAMVEHLGYYVDINTRELFLPVAQEFASAVKIAKMFDYRVKGAAPAGVTLTFTSSIPASADITIPVGTVVKTATDEVFTTTGVGVILAGTTSITVPAKQWEAVIGVALGNSNGTSDQVFVLEEGVADGSITIRVDVVTYTAQDTFVFSLSNSEHYIAGLQEDTQMAVTFGDGINGKVPPSGQAITADYYITKGSAGNVGAGKINTIVSTITVPGSEVISVNNAQNATGGVDAEDLTKLKKRIPMSIRTKDRAVTEQDFIDLTEMVQGVERGGVQFDCDIDEFVRVFVAPEGGGLASPALLTDVYNYINVRRIINTRLQTFSAGVLDFILAVSVKAKPGYSNANVKNAVEQALLSFFGPTNQEIKGSVVIGDVYEAIEEADGVLSSEITLISTVPYARNLVTASNVLNWTRVLLPASTTTVKWLIRFITNSQYELFKEDEFQGTFNVNVLVSMPEIQFTVNGLHVGGDNYEFYTYAYNKSVTLAEPSIPSTSLSKLTISVTGGV